MSDYSTFSDSALSHSVLWVRSGCVAALLGRGGGQGDTGEEVRTSTLHCIALHCTVLYNTAVQYSTVHCSVVQYSTLHCSAVYTTAGSPPGVHTVSTTLSHQQGNAYIRMLHCSVSTAVCVLNTALSALYSAQCSVQCSVQCTVQCTVHCSGRAAVHTLCGA